MIALELPADLRALRIISAWVRAVLSYSEDGVAQEAAIEDSAYRLALALQEICVNVVEHAYRGRADGRLGVGYEAGPMHRFVVTDDGVPFDPADRPEVDLDRPTEGGYGLFLAETLCDEVRYERRGDCNRWTLSLRRCAQLVD